MNTENYEQLAVNQDLIGDALKFVKENEICKVCSYNGNVFSVEPPLFVELEITDTEPGFKGDTAPGASKPATVETGAVVSVPRFVEIGDRIKIDIPNLSLELDVPQDILDARRAAWQPREPKVTTGYLARYAAMVTSGNRGAILEVPKAKLKDTYPDNYCERN